MVTSLYLYIQCASHLNLGYAIRVINPGDPVPPQLRPGQGTDSTDGDASLRMSGIVTSLSVLLMTTLWIFIL